ncbi:hypothetical protein ACQ4PT_000399 [Festuca glaucescens]
MDVLMDGLSSELIVGRDQSITVWYFNMIIAQDVKLTKTDEFHLMFDMYRAERRLALSVVVLDNSYSETPGPMLDNVEYVPEPTIPDNDVLLVGFQGFPLTPNKNAASQSTSPLKQSTQVVPSTSAIETDPFDIVEEYVGVDDEYMYDVHLDVSATCVVNKGGDVQVEEDDVFAHHEEEEVADTHPAGYSVVHDPENPDIRVGTLFPDIVACRKAIRQRAIIVGFKLAKIKTDSTRFIAQCTHETCKWRIHASVLRDGKMAMIKTLPFEHNCLTKKLENCKMASRGWIADRIGDWVKKNPGVGAKDAKAKLEDEYNIKLDYNKTCINGDEISTYVDDYYSMEKFKAAYVGRIPSMTDKSQWINVDLGFKVHPPLQKAVAGRPRVQRIRGWLEPRRKIVKCKRCKELSHMEKTCKVPDPKYVALDDDIPIDEPIDEPDPSISTNKRKKDDEAAATADGDASDDEILINLIRKKARTTPEKPSAATQEKAKKKTPVKAKKKTPVKAKKKTPVKNTAAKEKAKKKTPVKKTTSTGKKTSKNFSFAPVIPPPPSPPAVQPATGAKRSLLYWLGG